MFSVSLSRSRSVAHDNLNDWSSVIIINSLIWWWIEMTWWHCFALHCSVLLHRAFDTQNAVKIPQVNSFIYVEWTAHGQHSFTPSPMPWMVSLSQIQINRAHNAHAVHCTRVMCEIVWIDIPSFRCPFSRADPFSFLHFWIMSLSSLSLSSSPFMCTHLILSMRFICNTCKAHFSKKK